MPNNFLDFLVSSYEFEEAVTPFLDQHGPNNLDINGVSTHTTGNLFNFYGDYDGVNDDALITNGSQSGLNIGTNSATMEAWIFETSGSAGNHRAFSKSTTLSNQGYHIGTVGNVPRLIVDDGTNSAVLTGSTPTGSAKVQIVMVIDRAFQLLRLYANGVANGTPLSIASVGSLSSTGPFCVGSHASTFAFFQGSIDRCRIWSGRVFTASEVSTLYNGGNGIAYADFEASQVIPIVLPGESPSIPSATIKHVLNSARYKGSTVLDTTNEEGKERLSNISTFRDTILSVMSATSRSNVHISTSAGRKLNAIAALNPSTATAADIINAAKNG